MLPKHICNQGDRILTLELTMANFIKNVEEKFDTIMKYLEDMPKTYATKAELKIIQDEIDGKTATKVAWIQNYGGLLSGGVGGVVALIIALLK